MEEIKREELEKVSSGEGPIYNEEAYPNGPCPLCHAGTIILQVSPSIPCNVGVCSHCYTAFMLD